MIYYLSHHGIEGQKWGVQNGPPYPLDYNQHSSEEKKHIRKYINPKTGELTKKGKKEETRIEKTRKLINSQIRENNRRIKVTQEELDNIKKKHSNENDPDRKYWLDAEESASKSQKIYQEDLNYWLSKRDLYKKPIYELSKDDIKSAKIYAKQYMKLRREIESLNRFNRSHKNIYIEPDKYVEPKELKEARRQKKKADLTGKQVYANKSYGLGSSGNGKIAFSNDGFTYKANGPYAINTPKISYNNISEVKKRKIPNGITVVLNNGEKQNYSVMNRQKVIDYLDKKRKQ